MDRDGSGGDEIPQGTRNDMQRDSSAALWITCVHRCVMRENEQVSNLPLRRRGWRMGGRGKDGSPPPSPVCTGASFRHEGRLCARTRGGVYVVGRGVTATGVVARRFLKGLGMTFG